MAGTDRNKKTFSNRNETLPKIKIDGLSKELGSQSGEHFPAEVFSQITKKWSTINEGIESNSHTTR
jgi:hypothetical protein